MAVINLGSGVTSQTYLHVSFQRIKVAVKCDGTAHSADHSRRDSFLSPVSVI